MDVVAAVELVDREVQRHTNKQLTDLQRALVTMVLQGHKYWEIADRYGCTEGHAKDTGSLLWKILSQVWGAKVTKNNLRSAIAKQLDSARVSSSEPPSDLVDRAVTTRHSEQSFVGRQAAIAQLHNLVARGNKIIVLQGEGGIGKTTLARRFLSQSNFDLTLEVLMAKETSNIVAVASVVEEWLQRDLNEDSGKEFGVTLARFKRCLERQTVGILIDNLEPALDRHGRLIPRHRDYIELLRILGDGGVRSTTLITSRDRLCEADLDLEHYRLTGLDLAAWQQYFTAHQIESEATLAEIRQLYSGNAKAMGILCGIVREDYGGDLAQYWQENGADPLVETDLKNLVADRFDRLQQLDPEAYKLLCRLGCYRYQDVSSISIAGVACLLWDATTKPSRIVKSLRNRSLLEFARGQYWLHPIVRAEAKVRLQNDSADWNEANRQIALFLTNRVKRIDRIQDGLTALEAYYHYQAIGDATAAAKVILYSRENQWGQYLTLGTTLYRMGIVEPLTPAIERLLELVEHPRYRSELNNILGDLYWTTGKVHQAIALQRHTIATSQHNLRSIAPAPENSHDRYYWRMLEVDSLLSLGLYQLDLWELDTAAAAFQQAIELAHNTSHHSWAEKASIGLALINSAQNASLKDPTVARLYRSIFDLEDPAYNTGRFAYFMQMLGQVFFNQQQLEPARKIWLRAIALSQSAHYTQIEAKSLIGLGKIERLNSSIIRANVYHQEAVELLEKIAAKCDLAEAYFQKGITLKTSQPASVYRTYFARAIAIYQKIPAPKQIEKINRADSSEL